MILDAILHLTEQRKEEAKGHPALQQAIQKEAYDVFTVTTQIQQALTVLLDIQQNRHMEQYGQYARHCLVILRKITQMFPSPDSYTHCFDY